MCCTQTHLFYSSEMKKIHRKMASSVRACSCSSNRCVLYDIWLLICCLVAFSFQMLVSSVREQVFAVNMTKCIFYTASKVSIWLNKLKSIRTLAGSTEWGMGKIFFRRSSNITIDTKHKTQDTSNQKIIMRCILKLFQLLLFPLLHIMCVIVDR